MQSIADQAAARNLTAAQFEGRIAVAVDDDVIFAEVEKMDATLSRVDALIARREPETVADVAAQFALFAELVDWDEGPAEALYASITRALARPADCRFCRGVIG